MIAGYLCADQKDSGLGDENEEGYREEPSCSPHPLKVLSPNVAKG